MLAFISTQALEAVASMEVLFARNRNLLWLSWDKKVKKIEVYGGRGIGERLEDQAGRMARNPGVQQTWAVRIRAVGRLSRLLQTHSLCCQGTHPPSILAHLPSCWRFKVPEDNVWLPKPKSHYFLGEEREGLAPSVVVQLHQKKPWTMKREVG